VRENSIKFIVIFAVEISSYPNTDDDKRKLPYYCIIIL